MNAHGQCEVHQRLLSCGAQTPCGRSWHGLPNQFLRHGCAQASGRPRTTRSATRERNKGFSAAVNRCHVDAGGLRYPNPSLWLRAGEWTPMDNTERNKGFSAIVRKFPVGAVSMVSPFNFPCAPTCRVMGFQALAWPSIVLLT